MTGLLSAVSLAFRIYTVLIFARVVLSWTSPSPYSPARQHNLVRLLFRATDPLILLVRRMIPPINGTIDISPVVALFVLEIARWVIVAVGSRIT